MNDGLFTAYDKNNKSYDHSVHAFVLEPVIVYGVRDDKCGYPHFLIYENKEWKWEKAKRFVPFRVMN